MNKGPRSRQCKSGFPNKWSYKRFFTKYPRVEGLSQRLRICLPMQGSRVPSLVRELRPHLPHGNYTHMELPRQETRVQSLVLKIPRPVEPISLCGATAAPRLARPRAPVTEPASHRGRSPQQRNSSAAAKTQNSHG